MSNGDEDNETPETSADDETEAEAEIEEETEAEGEIEAGEPETFEARLDAVEAEIEAAETEAALDEAEARLDAIEAEVEETDFPEPDEEDEDAEDEGELLADRIDEIRGQIEDSRGPYAEDVVDDVAAAGETIDETRWTERGRVELLEAVGTFVEEVESTLDTDLGATVTNETDTQVAALEDAAVAIGAAELHVDDDRETIAALVKATEALTTGVEEAEEWTDLSIRDRLDAEGYYDVLDHLKDYPPEWHALKVYEKRGDVEMILLAYDMLTSNFMEEHCIDALKKLGDERALEPMLELAGKRDKDAIEVLGKIGSPEALDTILEYVDTPSDPTLQLATLKAVGEIGSQEATQEAANQLVAENAEVRSAAARSLGLIGDTRAIEPLADVLENDDEDKVRASAAWALNQIGTRRALDAVAEYADDRAFLVQSEASKAV